jgi:hypothetical protein
MWWITLLAGVLAVSAGLGLLVRAFASAGGGRERGAAVPPLQLVVAAMAVTGGLFLSFVSLANLVAAGVIPSPG